MKTLKKTLALVLALVMVVGTLAISASAASDNLAGYDDKAAAKASDYADAANVSVGLGIIKGYSDKELGINLNLTREQAAKVAAYLKLGESLAEKLPASATAFTDVAASDWASKYIAYIASEGIINGNGDGTFAPQGELTGYAFAKILLNSLGKGISTTDKGEKVNAYTGNYWMTKVAQDAATVGIFAGVAADVDLTSAISRGVAMQMLYNALKADNAAAAKDQKFNDSYHWTATNGTDNGQPIVTLTKGTTPIAVIAADPTATATVTAATAGAFSADQLNKVFGVAADATSKYTTDGATVYLNGEVATTAFVAGDEVAIYANNMAVNNVQITRYALAKVTGEAKVTTAPAAPNKDAKVKYTLTFVDNSTMDVYDINVNGTLAKDDYVIVACQGDALANNKILAVKTAEQVSGKVTASKGATYYIGSKGYASTVALTVGSSEGTWALDAQGRIAMVVTAKEAAKVDDYIFIYSVLVAGTNGNVSDTGVVGTGSKTYTVYGVDNNGKLMKAAVKEATAKAITGEDSFSVGQSIDTAKLTGYKMVDGYLTIAAGNLTANNLSNYSTTGNAKIGTSYANANTTFYFLSVDKGEYKVETIKGYKTVKVENPSEVGYLVDSKNTATVVFVKGAAATVGGQETPATLVFVKSDDLAGLYDGTKYTYTLTALDGSKVTFTTNTDVLKDVNGDVAANSLVAVKTTDGALTSVEVLTPFESTALSVVDYVSGAELISGDNEYNVANAKVYEITVKDGNYSVASGELKKDQKVYLVGVSANDKTPETVIIVPAQLVAVAS